MKKIILLTGSRSGSHYLCTLYNTAYNLNHMPEILNADHWPAKKYYIPDQSFDVSTAFDLLRKQPYYITKYYTGYEYVSPDQLFNFASDENCDFYFLYRKSNISTFVSYMYMRFNGVATEENLQSAAEHVKYNNTQLTKTYKIFKPFIKKVFTYEDLKFDKSDLELLGVTPLNGTITCKAVSDDQFIRMQSYNLHKYVETDEFLL